MASPARSAPRRCPTCPRSPSLPGFDIQAWYGFVGPAGLPQEVVTGIHADAAAIIQRPDFQERLSKDGIEPVANTPQAFAAPIKTDVAR